MTAKRDRDLLAGLERIGYEFDHTNSKGVHFYVHPDTGAQVGFPSGCDERRVRDVLAQAYRQIGLPTKANKRNPGQIRERNSAEHARAARELEHARTSLDAARSASEERRLRDAEAVFLRADRRFRYWDRLMRENGNAA